MHRLSLQTKAFITLTILLAVMMMMFVGFSRVGLQRGLGPYVAEIELARMDWLAYRLQGVHQQYGSWTPLKENPAMWRAIRRPLMSGHPLKTRERLSEVRYEIRGELARRAREGDPALKSAPHFAPRRALWTPPGVLPAATSRAPIV